MGASSTTRSSLTCAVFFFVCPPVTRADWGGRCSFTRVPIDDVHYKKMAIYKEVPLWWYAAITLASFVMASASLSSRSPFPIYS